MNPLLDKLQPYPFEKLAKLKAGIVPPAHLSPINLSIGEPQHPTPAALKQALIDNFSGLARYPVTRGADFLREAIADWLCRRFKLPVVDPARQILPVNGSREALFAFAQAVIDSRRPNPLVLMPNPFYQIYEGAALLAGANPFYLNCLENNGFLPDFNSVSEQTWRDCQLLYLCSPANPSGAVIPFETLQQLILLAEKYQFVIASDECYSELYFDETDPPPGLLQAAAVMGNVDYKRCIVFHSLSKRSSSPGLRSGFVAGDAEILEKFFLYRTYHGCAMSPPVQAASAAAWQDETHVRENRVWYREKFAAVKAILEERVNIPPASFYLWLQTPINAEQFTQALFAQQHLTVLPGSYLSRQADGIDPGKNRVRIALVAPLAECCEAAQRLLRVINHFCA